MRKTIILAILLCFVFSTATFSTALEITHVSPNDGAKDVSINPTLSVSIDNASSDFNWEIAMGNKSKNGHCNSTSNVFELELSKLSYETDYWWYFSLGSQSFVYKFTTESEEDENDFSKELSVFPNNPSSGETLAIILGNRINTNGYLYVGNDLIPVTISNGFGTVKLKDSQYGEASVWIYGPMDGTNYEEEFTVDCGLTGNLEISADSKANINDEIEVTVSYGSTYIEGAKLEITNPDGNAKIIYTDGEGKAHFVADKSGTWMIQSEYLDTQAVEEITIEAEEISVDLDDDKYSIDEKVTISAEILNGDVLIEKEGEIIEDGELNSGTYTFYPQSEGKYDVIVKSESGDQQGTSSFTVSKIASISVSDLNNIPVSTAEHDERYMIKILDQNDDLLKDFSFVYAGQRKIPLSGGIGFWSPLKSGNILFTLPDKKGYETESHSVSVGISSYKSKPSENDDSINWIGVIFLIIIVVALLMYVYKDKLPDNIKNIFGRFFKPKREVPI